MRNKGLIIPAILEEEVEGVVGKLERIRGKVTRVGIDVIDGLYADNLTVGIEELAEVNLKGFEVEVQLMTEYPVDYLQVCADVGITRVYGQIERMHDQEEFVTVARELGLEVGLGVDLHTPIEEIGAKTLELIDGVLLMGVKAGFSGQKFEEAVVEKIIKLRKSGFEKAVQMDGGMNPETIEKCWKAGADQFSVTSYLWQSERIETALASLYEAIK